MLRLRACLTPLATSTLCVVVCAISLNSAQALNCLSGTARFELTSDPAYWSIVLPSGVQCTQELRYPPLRIDDVTIITPPRNGSLIVDGPSFRYLPNPEFIGLDSFVISVSGSNGRMSGSTYIYADVTVR